MQFPKSFAFLATLFNSFERIKYVKLHISYRPAVGTTQGGMVSYAIDWTSSQKDKDRKALSSFTPNCAHAAWQDTSSKPLVLPPSRLQSRVWYLNNDGADLVDRAPGRLLYAVDASSSVELVVGELWVDYEVVLSGTKS